MAGVPFFVTPLPFTVIAASASDAGHPASNLSEMQFAGMTWIGTAASAIAVYGDLAASSSIDFFSVMGANAQSGTTITVRLGDTAAELDAPVAGTFSDTRAFIVPATAGRAAYNSHLELAAPVTKRYFSVSITGHAGDFTAAFVVVGRKVQPSMYYEPEWDAGPIDLSSLAIGRNGVPDIAPGVIQRTIGFTLGWQTEAEFQTKMQPLANAAGKVNPVYLCFDPEPTTYRQDRTYFGRFTDSLKTTKKGWNRFTRSFTMQSMI